MYDFPKIHDPYCTSPRDSMESMGKFISTLIGETVYSFDSESIQSTERTSILKDIHRLDRKSLFRFT